MLDVVRRKMKGAVQMYRLGGIWVLLCYLFALLWGKCAWLYIRTSKPNKLIKRRINGSIMYLNLEDRGISRELAVYKTHEPISTLLLQQEIKSGMHVVDIGANSGYFTLLKAKLVGKDGEVIAIEPEQNNMRLLKRNIEANGYHNIRVYEFAIGAENGLAKLYLSDKSNLCSLLSHSESNGRYSTVAMRTLDSLLENEKHIDHVQMDMEGYETEAVKGMLEILKRHHPGILLELHPHLAGVENAIDLLGQLKGLGYRTKYVVERILNNPFIKSKRVVETPSIDTLIADARIRVERTVFNIFLETTGH